MAVFRPPNRGKVKEKIMAASATNTNSTPPAGADRGATTGGGLVAYLNGVREELRKAVWPNKTELIHLTQVVLMIIAVVAVYCGVLDGVLGFITNRVFQRGQ